MKYVRVTQWIINSLIFTFLLGFVLIGPNDLVKLSNIFEKIATINITISIGYGALLAAIAALASHNTNQDKRIKTSLESFVFITIFYVLLNATVFLTSFMIDEFFDAVLGRILIGLLIIMLIFYSNILLKISVKLIY